MNRRSLLQSLAGCLCFPLFLTQNKKQKEQSKKTSPVRKTFKAIGEIKEIKFYTEYENIFYTGNIYPYIQFPIKTAITIIGEYGELEYHGFNLKLEDMQELHRNPWYIVYNIKEYSSDELGYTEVIKYKNFEMRLARVSLYNKVV